MTRAPPKDLLESVHKFPCFYTFKVVGTHRPGFLDEVLAAVVGAMPAGSPAPKHRLRSSATGRHLAITVIVHADSVDVVLAIYAAFGPVSGIATVI